VSDALEPLRQPLQDLESGSVEGGWEGAREAVGRATDALRGAWGVRMPEGQAQRRVALGGGKGWAVAQARLQHFLMLVGASVARHCQVGSGLCL
jgi:hypothetical protein